MYLKEIEKACNTHLCYMLDDPYGIRTRVTAVKGRCLNHLTNGPWLRRQDSNLRQPD